MILFVIIMIYIMSSIFTPRRYFYGGYYRPMFFSTRHYRPMGHMHYGPRPMPHSHMHGAMGRR